MFALRFTCGMLLGMFLCVFFCVLLIGLIDIENFWWFYEWIVNTGLTIFGALSSGELHKLNVLNALFFALLSTLTVIVGITMGVGSALRNREFWDFNSDSVGIMFSDVVIITLGYTFFIIIAIFSSLLIVRYFGWHIDSDGRFNGTYVLIALVVSAAIGSWLGWSGHTSRYEERKCPLCKTTWARRGNGKKETISKENETEAKTETKYRTKGSKRQSRTVEVEYTYEIHRYKEFYDCMACGEESSIPRSEKSTVGRKVTATTPWQ